MYYWGAASSFKLFGVNEAAARLPSAVSALLGTLALACLAWRLYGSETARWLLLLLPTTVGMIGFSHAAATDMPFSGMLTVAMVAAAELLGLKSGAKETVQTGAVSLTPSQVTFARLGFGIALGLAVLAKGPAGLILCGGGIFFWAIATKRWRNLRRLLHPVTVGIFLATALPWYILCARRNPDFFRIFIVEHNFKRFLTPVFQHIQPFWFYVPIVAVALLPWVPLLAWSIWQGIARATQIRRISDRTAYFLSWALFCLAFFSVSQSKLPGYILPSIPPLVLLLARSYTGARTRSQAFQLVHLIAALLLAMLFATWELALPYVSPRGTEFGLAVASVVVAISAANLVLGATYAAAGKSTFRDSAAAFSVLPILLVLLFSNQLVTSIYRVDPSGKSIAGELRDRNIPTAETSVHGMNRAEHYAVNFYLHDEVRDWDALHPFAGYVVASRRSCGDLVPIGWTCEEIPFKIQTRNKSIYRVARETSMDGVGGSKVK
jgi:4-amino-4-deoxy-L-arabinose transferase-like glycosyltransferase